MPQKLKVSCVVLVVLLVSCSEENSTTIRVDPEKGFYWLQPGDQALGPIGLYVNGSPALEGAFLFYGADSIVAINSLGDLDLVSVFKGDSTGGSVQLILINTGDENQMINGLELCNLCLDEGFRIAWMNRHQVMLERSQLPASVCCLQTDTSSMWDFTFLRHEDSLSCAFNVSGTSIVLLPEEELSLPPLLFFYHLCAD